MTAHDPMPRSLDLDESVDPARTHRCRACGQEGDFEDLFEQECSQTVLALEGAA